MFSTVLGSSSKKGPSTKDRLWLAGALAVMMVTLLVDVPSAHPLENNVDAESSLVLVKDLFQGRRFAEAADVLEALRARNEDPIFRVHLADAYYNLGQTRRAVTVLDSLVSDNSLGDNRMEESRLESFVLNRRGIILAEAGDILGARESYKRALANQKNRHAMYNLAMLLHYSVFPTAAASGSISILGRAIELYQEALGDASIIKTMSLSSTAKSRLVLPRAEHIESENSTPAQHEEIGGPVDRVAVSQDLAIALLEVGRAHEAVIVMENAMMESNWTEDFRSSGVPGEPSDERFETVTRGSSPRSREIMLGTLRFGKHKPVS